MPWDKREVIRLLRQEILDSRRGRGGATFGDTALCLSPGSFPSEPCSHCPLLEFVPPACRQRPLPCFDIPLDSTGRTLDLLTQKTSLNECNQAIRAWMERTLKQLEKELAAEETAPPPGGERRRSWRFALVEPVTVGWLAAVGYGVKAHGETAVVNAHGGILRMTARLSLAPEIELTRDRTGDSTRIRVLRVADSVGDDLKKVAY